MRWQAVTPPLRHSCQRCGASCTGHRVLLQEGEAAKIAALAEQLGIVDPIDGATLRQVGGRCVFLTAEDLCGIHALQGPAAKPLTCQQYPLVVVRTEDGLRLGLDPGCLTTWNSWRTGPKVTPERALASRVEFDPDTVAVETWVLTLCEQAKGVGPLLGSLVDERSDAGFPDAWALAWAQGCRRIGLPAPEVLPRWRLGAEAQALAIETVRRMVDLRLASELGAPDQVARLVLGGVLLAAWRDPALPAFGTGLAQWTRALRQPEFFARLARAAP
jgi:Fe-S-cluster containining protein